MEKATNVKNTVEVSDSRKENKGFMYCSTLKRAVNQDSIIVHNISWDI